MARIRQDDFITSIADALQRPDLAQLLTNSRLSAEGRRPICQDTGLSGSR